MQQDMILKSLQEGYTPYHVVDIATQYLQENGFTALLEEEAFSLTAGGKYYVVRGGTSLIAFTVGEEKTQNGFKIVASHTDSPALKVKYEPVMQTPGGYKLNVETYGGGIYSTFTDIPLKLAGRLAVKKDGRIYGKTFTDDHTYVIPNLAIHMNRKANDGFVYNAQTDLAPFFGLAASPDYFKTLGGEGEEVLGYDLFVVSGQTPFIGGADHSYFCAPRIDNLASVFASLGALVSAPVQGVNVAYLACHEEIGSRTLEGADSDFLKSVLMRVHSALGGSLQEESGVIAKSFLLSADNTHALHPNHPELSDPTNKVVMGGGVAIKHHANRNYITDGLTSALVSEIFARAGVKTQHFFMRSDLRCGSTLGTIAQTQTGIPGVDIGAPQLAMHSALETMALSDLAEYEKAITAFFATPFTFNGGAYVIKK